MTEPLRDDPEHDAWLRAALAHAPDADVAAPAALSAAILRAAAARSAPKPTPWQRFLDAWAWLARPPVAAAFASGMVAGVVGLMWWDRPMDDAMPRSPIAVAPMAVTPAEKASAASVLGPASTAMPKPKQGADASPAAAPEVARATVPTGPRERQTVRSDMPPRDEMAAQESADREVARAETDARGAPSDAAARPASRAAAAAARMEAPPAPAAMAAPAPANAAASADNTTAYDEFVRQRRSESVADERAPTAAAVPPVPAAPAPALGNAAGVAPAPSESERLSQVEPSKAAAEQRSLARAAQARLRAAPVASSLPSPITALLSRWPTAPAEWRWQPPGGTAPQAADAAAQAWLQRVERATRGRWQNRPAEPEGAESARWWQGELPLGTLHFEPQGLAWRGADGSAAFAPLDAATLAALRAF